MDAEQFRQQQSSPGSKAVTYVLLIGLLLLLSWIIVPAMIALIIGIAIYEILKACVKAFFFPRTS